MERKMESISPTFYERNCADFLAPIKSLTFTSSTKKLCAKLLYEKAAWKMLVKLTPGRTHKFLEKISNEQSVSKVNIVKLGYNDHGYSRL